MSSPRNNNADERTPFLPKPRKTKMLSEAPGLIDDSELYDDVDQPARLRELTSVSDLFDNVDTPNKFNSAYDEGYCSEDKILMSAVEHNNASYTNSSLDDLNDYYFERILKNMAVEDVVRLSQVSKKLNQRIRDIRHIGFFAKPPGGDTYLFYSCRYLIDQSVPASIPTKIKALEEEAQELENLKSYKLLSAYCTNYEKWKEAYVSATATVSTPFIMWGLVGTLALTPQSAYGASICSSAFYPPVACGYGLGIGVGGLVVGNATVCLSFYTLQSIHEKFKARDMSISEEKLRHRQQLNFFKSVSKMHLCDKAPDWERPKDDKDYSPPITSMR